jgi:acyl-coenzyme A synthetase/AMP-(fatty) acid ligase
VFLSAGDRGAFAQMRARGVNILIASPAALEPLIRDAAQAGLPRIEGPVLVAGGRLSAGLRDRIRADVCTRVMVAYGSSEAGGVTLGDADALDTHPGRVGAVFGDIEAEVVDPKGAPLLPGAEGRLRIRTDSTVPGYINDDAASASFFDGGWFYPGDIAALSDRGDLTLLGRTTQILNFGGVKVPVEELEERLRRVEGVEEACAFLVAQGPTEPTLVIVVVAQTEAAEGLGTAIRAAFPRLPPFGLFSARELPRGSMGKIRKQEVAEAVGAAPEGPVATDGGLALVPLGTA